MVENKTILADIKYLSKFYHTGSLSVFQSLPVFHSVLNKYCSKWLHFTLEGMMARTQLAVLDYNCGSCSTQAETKDGKQRYKQIFSKSKVGLSKKYPKQKIENIYANYYLPH